MKKGDKEKIGKLKEFSFVRIKKKKAKRKKAVTNPFYGKSFDDVLGEAVKPLASK